MLLEEFLKTQFIDNKLTTQNIKPPVSYSSKLKLSSKDVTLKFCLTRPSNRFYDMEYFIIINPGAFSMDPSYSVSPRNIDMVSLRNAIVSQMSASDTKYMILIKFDDRKAVFRFNVDKWIKDTTFGIKPETYLTKFNRKFKLKVPPPQMVMTDFILLPLEKYIIDRF